MTSSAKAAWLLLALVWVASKRPAARLSLAQLRSLAVSVGFPDPDLAAAVAMAESGGNPSIIGDVTKGGSFGLWQIHGPSHPEWASSNLFDPTTNARAALAISKNGVDWSPWSTFKNGLHKQYLPNKGTS